MVHAFPSTFQNSPSIIPFPDCWILPCLAGGWCRTLKSWLKPSLQALRCQRGFTSATLVLHTGLLHERAQNSLACLPVASKGLIVAHKLGSVFCAASGHLGQDFQTSRTYISRTAGGDVEIRCGRENLSAALPSLWLFHSPGTVGTASVEPLPACHGMGNVQFSRAQ